MGSVIVNGATLAEFMVVKPKATKRTLMNAFMWLAAKRQTQVSDILC